MVGLSSLFLVQRWQYFFFFFFPCKKKKSSPKIIGRNFTPAYEVADHPFHTIMHHMPQQVKLGWKHSEKIKHDLYIKIFIMAYKYIFNKISGHITLCCSFIKYFTVKVLHMVACMTEWDVWWYYSSPCLGDKVCSDTKKLCLKYFLI